MWDSLSEATENVHEHVLSSTLLRYRDGTAADVAEQVILLKFCVSNFTAGAIIGRAGANRQVLEGASRARVQLSRPNEYYPGTTDRVLLLIGTLAQCLAAKFTVAVRLGRVEPLPMDTMYMGMNVQFKLLLPSRVCGYLIGAGGRAIRALAAEAEASISISPEQPSTTELPPERIATISGGLVQALRAVGLMVDKLLMRPFLESGEQSFEGVFPSSRMAVLSRSGVLRNPPNLQPQQPPPPPGALVQQPAPMAMPGQHFYMSPQPAAGGMSTLVYFPLQPFQAAGAASMMHMGLGQHMGVGQPLGLGQHMGVGQSLGMGPPMGLGPQHVAMGQAMGLPTGAGTLQALTAMPLAAMPHQARAAGPVQGLPMAQVASMSLAQSQPQVQPQAGGAQAGAAGSQSLGGAQAGGAEVVGPRLEVSIEVPENRIGLLIGRGGETLQSMQRLMHVNIHIPRRPPGDLRAMRRVTISGTRTAVINAHAVILDRLERMGGRAAAAGRPGSDAASPGRP